MYWYGDLKLDFGFWLSLEFVFFEYLNYGWVMVVVDVCFEVVIVYCVVVVENFVYGRVDVEFYDWEGFVGRWVGGEVSY